MNPEPLDTTHLLIAAAALLLLALPPLVVLASKPKKKEIARTVVVVSCSSCGYTEKRQYTRYIYVGMRVGKCPKCGGELKVKTIYVEKLVVARQRTETGETQHHSARQRIHVQGFMSNPLTILVVRNRCEET